MHSASRGRDLPANGQVNASPGAGACGPHPIHVPWRGGGLCLPLSGAPVCPMVPPGIQAWSPARVGTTAWMQDLSLIGVWRTMSHEQGLRSANSLLTSGIHLGPPCSSFHYRPCPRPRCHSSDLSGQAVFPNSIEACP